jgi:hypothetical protein
VRLPRSSRYGSFIYSLLCLSLLDQLCPRFHRSRDWENNSFVEFKYPQDLRFRLRTTQWKISDKDLTDAGPLNANINLEQKFGNVKKCYRTISGDKLVFRCEDCNRGFKNEKGLRIHGPMNQSFLCESFSSKIDKKRTNGTINQTLSTSMDYEM